MKTLMASLAIAGFLLIPSEASAWYCRAQSPTGAWGWGQNYNLAAAKRRALWECAVRTPRGYVCYITYCR